MDFPAIGRRLKQVRGELKLTLNHISETTGFSKSLISEFENGKKKPSTIYLYGLVHNYRVDVHYVLTGEGSPFRTRTGNLEMDPAMEEMFMLMSRLKIARYAMLSEFHLFKVRNRDEINVLLEEPGESGSTDFDSKK